MGSVNHILSSQLIQALNYSESIVVLTDVTGCILYVNDTFTTKYGYSRQEAIGNNPRILNTGYHNKAFYEDLWDTIRSGHTWKGIFRNRTKSGHLLWEKATISPVKDSNQKVTGYIAIKEDVTRQRELEKQIEDDKFFLDELFNNAPVGILIFDYLYDQHGDVKNLMVVKANPFASKILGRLGVVGLPTSTIFPGDILTVDRLVMMKEGKSSFEGFIGNLNKYLRFRSFPFGSDKLCLFFYDVTPYKHTIEALEASEERYFSLVEDAPAMICRFNHSGELTYVNQQFCKEMDQSRKELVGRNIFDWMSMQERESTRANIESLSSQSPMVEMEHKIILDNDEEKWQRWVYRALLNSEGAIVEYQSVGMDFTRLKVAEEALRKNRNKLDAIVNNTAAGIGVMTRDGYFSLVNEKFLNLMGYNQPEELYKISNLEITHPEFRDVTINKMDQLKNGLIDEFELEKKFIRKDGSYFWGELHMSPIKNQAGEVEDFIGILTDISQRKKYQVQIQESEAKLRESNAAKDKLFSIIAHDVRNPFNIILGFSNVLKTNLHQFSIEEVQQFVDQIYDASENVYELLSDLLLWAKTQLGQLAVNKEDLNINELVEHSCKSLLSHANEKNITLNNLVSKSLIVQADYEMLKMVFRNLIHNAIKFTESGGTVRIDSHSEVLDNKKFQVLTVNDNGIGIKAEKLNKLFDLDRIETENGTSNEKGTGLGLHLCRELIDNHKGYMKVESEVGVGTKFLIYLPDLIN